MLPISEPTPLKSSNKWVEIKEKLISKQQEMDFTYTNMDTMIRLSLGENPHFSNAFYDGDYKLNLEEAQLKKYKFICDNLSITKNSKVLDMGCGWGGFLKHIRKFGALGTGVNLSTGQIENCRKIGLNVYLKDMRYIKPEDFGIFDAVTAIGSFDHVCSTENYVSGNQDTVYDSYFRHVANLLPKGGRFFIQTMTFSKNMISYDEFDINAPKDSAAYLLAILAKHFPDSWLPYGGEHVIRVAAPYFKMIYYSSGRLDYIQTQKEWWKRIKQFNVKKYLWFLSFIPRFITNSEFRHQLSFMKFQPLIPLFEREVMDHSRIIFEKI